MSWLCFFSQKFFSHKEQKEDFQLGLNHNKYMVTDNAAYIGDGDLSFIMWYI